jgi:hypothetical protein
MPNSNNFIFLFKKITSVGVDGSVLYFFFPAVFILHPRNYPSNSNLNLEDYKKDEKKMILNLHI